MTQARVTGSVRDAGSGHRLWGSGKEVRSPSPHPLRTVRALFQCIRLKHRTTPRRGTTGRGSAGPRHHLRDAAAPLALGSTWTLLRQGRLPKFGEGRTRALPHVTDLLCPPSRLAVGSCPPTPEGSRLAFARVDVATPIRPVAGQPSLPPSSFTRRPIGSPCGGPTLAGERRAYHVPSQESSWVRPRLDAGGSSSRRMSLKHPTLAAHRLVQACQRLWLVVINDASGGSPGLAVHAPLVPDRRGAGSHGLVSCSGRHPCG